MQRRDGTRQCRASESGFSLLEMAFVMAIVIIMASVGIMSLQPSLKAQRVTNGYNTTLAALRQARDNAVAQRTSYSVTFTASTTGPNTITLAPTLTTFQGVQNSTTYTLPNDIAFTVVSGVPSSATPDGFGAASTAVDFGYTSNGTGTGGASVLYFCPDGSAQDAAGGVGSCQGNMSSGVVYLARPGELLSSRALTVWGATGRIHGWRLYPNNSGGYTWVRQ